MSLAIFKIESWGANISAMIKTLLKTFGLVYFSSKKPYDVTILEYWIDTPGEMSFLLSIAKPHISILTKIDAVHSEQFGNPQEIAKEETKLQRWTLETCIINYDDSYWRSLRDYIDVDLLRYDTNECDASDIAIRYNNYSIVSHGETIASSSDISFGSKKIHVTTPIIWKHNHSYIAVGLAITDIVHHKLYWGDCVQKSWWLHLDVHLQSWRMTVFEWIEQSVILDSSYNASPLSMQAAINDTYRIQRDALPDHKVILVLWDMRELGEWEEKHHRELAGYLSQYGDTIFLIGAATEKYTMNELKKIWHDMENIYHFSHYTSLGKSLKKYIEEHKEHKYIILFKWSQNTIFLEESIKPLLRHATDEKKLTRQGDRRMAKKKRVMQDANLE